MNSIYRMAQPPDNPTHALHVIDNWDGEGNQAFLFAFERDGEFYDHETGKPVLEYKGDEIIQVWTLTPNAEFSGAGGLIACVRVERRVRGQKSAVAIRQTKGKK